MTLDHSATATEQAPGDLQGAAVVRAFSSLRDALAALALADPAAFDRATAFRAQVMKLSERWNAGQPAHTPRGKAGSP